MVVLEFMVKFVNFKQSTAGFQCKYSIYVYMMSFQSRLLRPSCCRCQVTNWLMLSFNWPSVEAPWLSHRTWCLKITCPKPVNQLTEKIKLPHPAPVKVFMKNVMFLRHVCLIFTLTICSALLCLAAQLKQFIKDSLSSQNSAFTLAHMTSLEKKLIKHFQVKDFPSLEKGTFLEFLAKHTQVKKKKNSVNLDFSTACETVR